MATGNIFNPNGSIGRLVHYTLKGKPIIRIKPAHMTNPRTPAQEAHRMKLKLASRFIKSNKKFIEIGYQGTSLDYPHNEARQFLMKNCFVNTADSVMLDYSKVMISRGEIKKPEDCQMTVADNQLSITWKKPVKGDKTKGTDKAMVTMFMDDGSDGTSELIRGLASRSEGSITIPIPKHEAPVQVWMFFYNAEEEVGQSKKNVSDSVWLGEIE